MRVLFVCSGNSDYGIAPFIKSQGESLVDKGIEIKYFTITGKGIIGYLRNILVLRKEILHNNYDLIHSHYGLTSIISLLSKTKDVPLIASYMGDDLLGIKKSKGSYTLFGKILTRLNKHQIKHHNNWSIVKSNEMKNQLKNLFNISVIPNGVNFKIFAPISKNVSRRELNLNINDKIILFPTDPSIKVKNFSLAQKAFSLFASNNKNLKIEIVYKKNQSILNLYYNAADVLLMTSFHEGSPNIIKEAMACNLPIVSTYVGDVKDVIGGTRGCYITMFEAADVAEKIDKALNFTNRTNGRENIKHLEVGIIADKIIDIYKKVMQK